MPYGSKTDMKTLLIHFCISAFLHSFLSFSGFSQTQPIPLPEHPRPDFQRDKWLNLNGNWAFRFDKDDMGLKENWQDGSQVFPLTIHVPFSWGSVLSGVKDEADIGWYQRSITIPTDWRGQNVALIIGASDWQTTVWIDGILLGKHEGGYTPFEFDLTPYLKLGQSQKITIRVDDKRRDFTLYGKQGYGNARGIWQTTYLEARPTLHLETLHFTPDIDNNKVSVKATLPTYASQDLALNLNISNVANIPTQRIVKGKSEIVFEIEIPNATLWTLENPFLYEVLAVLGPISPAISGGEVDSLKTYFGMRKISTMNLPNTNYPYVALNNQPIYLQLALDQSYHPEGFYTFPTDEFMKDEIKMAKDIGLNGIRTHIKIDIPRKLYWADKLGLLIMSDLPNFWSDPTPEARAESEKTLPELIKRDFNHPSIFSWVIFNEQWGLKTKVEENGKKTSKYLAETQQWVVGMYRKAKTLDPTRLVEDNSICCGGGHTETDINSWHEYLPGYGWEKHLKYISDNTYNGSDFHFEKGFKQGNQPNINSEFGNVWGYEGSSGDVDWSWDYHRAMNTFRKYPKIAGWLYTEHHDVINEWNGYWKFDRSKKFTGFESLVNGMTIKDLHTPFYISTGQNISQSVKPAESVMLPLFISCMTGQTDIGTQLTLKIETYLYDAFGRGRDWLSFERSVNYMPYMQQAIEPLFLMMPAEKSVVLVKYILMDKNKNILHRNFSSYIVEAPMPTQGPAMNGKHAQILSIVPKDFTEAKWSQKQWNVLDGLKVNGAGSGYFEYKIQWPKNIKKEEIAQAVFVMEASSKPLLGKDSEGAKSMSGDYMLGGGTFDPSRNPNAYPMTDEKKFPSAVIVSFNGVDAGKFDLPDDPADSRGILSWHYQPEKGKLYEAGTYGNRVAATLPLRAIEKAQETGELVIRLSVNGNGGLAIYSDKFGRYPFNPFVMIKIK